MNHAYVNVTVHSHEIRDKKKCTNCGRRRLCTRYTLNRPDGSHIREAYLCNPCIGDGVRGITCE